MDDIQFLDAEADADAPKKREAAKETDPYDLGAAETALNEAAKRVNGVWISFILLCVYIFIATYTVTPAALFRDAPVRLPIFNADLPLKVYFVMAPVLILTLHAYLIVLTEKIDAYEYLLKRSVKIASGRRALRARLDNSIIVRAVSAQYRDTRGGIDRACRFIARLTMFIMPAALLLLTQLVFLPYQDEWMTWTHRGFIIVDFALCLWLALPLQPPWPAYIGRLVVVALVWFAALTSIFIIAFPGESIYVNLYDHWPHGLTVKYFEGPPDPVDYVHKGGVLPFPNRLILPDDPKLAEIAGAPAGGVSLSVRGRNFRKAVFDRSNLARVDFSAADLEGASLQGAKLLGARFECAIASVFFTPDDAPNAATWVEGSNCTKLDRGKLWNAALVGASFRGARMSGAELKNATVTRADFSRAMLRGADFTNAHGRAANFSSAQLMGADFQSAIIRAANFTEAGLQGARLSNSHLQAADFQGAHMQAVDLNSASLQVASFEDTFLHAATFFGAEIEGASFKGAALQDASLECAKFFRSDFENAGLDQMSRTARPELQCETGWYDVGFSYDYSYLDRVTKYDQATDELPKKQGYDSYGWSTIYPDSDFIPELQHPEKLDAKSFADVLGRLTSDLPDDTKARVARAFERLKPAARTKEQDDAEKFFWADWAKKSAPQESHDKALAKRLEDIACVGEGAPYVARGLLRAGRFDQLGDVEKMNDQEKSRIKRINQENSRILHRLKKASDGGDSSCPGARGLVQADFPKPVQAK